MYLVYLAAGRGSRLPKQYRKRPKCMTKIKNKTIFERNLNFFKYFKKKIIITGYKKQFLKKYVKKYNFKEIVNKDYKKTNMVHSLLLAKKNLNKTNDIVVCYGDILFDNDIFEFFREKNKNVMPVNKNWLTYWKKRFKINMIKNDAEDIMIKNNKLLNIGSKIKKKFPKYQFMGIFKISFKTFKGMRSFYLKINDKKIDMTNFINLCIKNKVIEFKTKTYSKMWYEIDSLKDIKIAEREINRW
mgnify:CR=1 FL=1